MRQRGGVVRTTQKARGDRGARGQALPQPGGGRGFQTHPGAGNAELGRAGVNRHGLWQQLSPAGSEGGATSEVRAGMQRSCCSQCGQGHLPRPPPPPP